jgi:hypothetical protein
MKLVIDRHWVYRCDNDEWMPEEWFDGDQKIFVHVFKKCVIICCTARFDMFFPLFKQFGGVESSYIGCRCIKISLDNPNVEVVDLELEKRSKGIWW